MSAPTRREMLATLLGASAGALAGCSPAAGYAGEIVGASDAAGHRLRDGQRPVPAAWTDLDVLIVGGGVAGLSAAWRLARAGCKRFVLLELESAVGGTARSGSSALTAYPWGAHYIPVPQRENRALIGLLDEMGLLEGRGADGEVIVREEFLVRDPEERVFYGGQWHEGLYPAEGADAEDLRQLQAFRREAAAWAAWRDARNRPAFTIPRAECSADPAVTGLDGISMAEWLDQKKFTSARLRWYVEYACRDDYGTLLQDTSAWAGLFYFASRSNPGADETQPLMTWPEGNGRLVAYLRQAAEGFIKTGVAVADIAPGQAGVQVSALDLSTNAALGFRARKVIFCAPQFMAGYLISDYRAHPPPHLREFQYGAWMVANIFLRGRPKQRGGFPLCWDNVLYDSPSLGYVVATHQSDLDYGPTVLTYYYPLCDTDPRAARRRLAAAGWKEWAEFALNDLSAAHPDIRALTERVDIMRWGHAMIRPRPGFMWSGAREKAAQPYRQIHFAHSDLSGIALFEEAFQHGITAADAVMVSLTA